jgi:hypothetical protein
VALNPGGKRILAAASAAGMGLDLSGSELYGAGNSEAHKARDKKNGNSSGIFSAMRIEFAFGNLPSDCRF